MEKLWQKLFLFLFLFNVSVGDGETIDTKVSPLCVVKDATLKGTWTYREQQKHSFRNPIGCVAQSLLDRKKTFEMTFKDNEASKNPSLCWESCRSLYDDSSLALISARQSGLRCHCGMADSLTSWSIGPSIFCNDICTSKELGQTYPCGGQFTFESVSKTEVYYSIYCLVFGNTTSVVDPTNRPPVKPYSPPPDGTDSTTKRPDPTTTPSQGNVDDGQINRMKQTLHNILDKMVSTNVMFIVIIILLLVVLLMSLLVCAWLCFCVRNLNPVATAELYKSISKDKAINGPKSPILEGIRGSGVHRGDRNIEYGTRNAAYEPSPEPPRRPNNEVADEREEEPSETIYKLGKSKFYRSRENILDEKNDDARSTETTETLDADDKKEIK